MAKNDDSLFLFEVLVDKVIFSKVPCFFDKDFKTCININCPAVEPIEICDDDTTNFPESKGPFLKVFNRGKSCLFSLKEKEISSCTSSFPVKVTIYKALPCGCLPTKIIIGECTIDMTKEFMESCQKYLSNPNDVSYQALKDSFCFVGPDGTETGEILMFLRISCFGNKIVTQFQGTPPATTLGDSGIVDRSCVPQKEFQSKEDPCACGAIHGLMGGKHDVCPPAEDKYNSMPCEEPEEPCFCSGPRSQKKQDMGCRNTFPYCVHVPKDCCPTGNKVVFQIPTGLCDLSHKQRAHFNFTSDGVGDVSRDDPDQLMPTNAENYPGYVQKEEAYFQYLAKQENQSKFLTYLLRFIENTEKSTIDRDFCLGKQLKLTHSNEHTECDRNTGLFGNTVCVYSMSGIEKDYSYFCTNGTQATALLNKCLQVHDCQSVVTVMADSKCCSTCADLSTPGTSCRNSTTKVAEHLLNPQLFFWCKKKQSPEGKDKGMGHKGSTSSASSKSSKKLKVKDSKQQKAKQSKELKGKESKTEAGKNVKDKVSKSTIKSAKSNVSWDSKQQSLKKGKDSVENIKNKKNTPIINIKDEKEAAASTSKKVSIDDKDVAVKDNIMVTISHIKIGATDICYSHCRDPDMKCHMTPPTDTDQGRIKVTSTNNPRRGVFELVVRKLTGAPLARNELLLEWSPPPFPCKPCAPPVPAYLPITRCLPSKCKRVICRPCKPRPCLPTSPCSSCNACRRPPCGRPCIPPPCRPICRPVRPPTLICSPVRYCPPALSPCKLACKPCKTYGPCGNPCKVGRRRPRKIKSQMKMKPRRTYVSPCLNRSRTCPLVACRSAPSCVICCK